MDVPLDRDLLTGEQLLGEEPAHGVRMQPGELRDARVARHVVVDVLEALDVGRIVDPARALREAPDDGLHEERRAERRPAVEQREPRRRGRHRRPLERPRGGLELAGDERARARAGRPRRSAISAASSAERSFVPTTPSAGIPSHSSTNSSGSKTSTASRSAPA